MRLTLVLGVLGVCACGSFGSGEGGGSADDGSADAAINVDFGLLGHWKLDETTGNVARDALGENPGDVVGGGWGLGKIGGAFSTGGSGYVSIPWTEKLNAPERFTITAWLNLDEKLDGDSYVFTHGYSFYVKLNRRKPQLGMGDGVNYNVTREVPSGGWHHLAVAFDAGVPAIYVDGYLGGANVNTMPATTRPKGGNSPLLIGCANGADYVAIGNIDDVRFYGRVLTVSEIKALAAGQ